MKPINKELIIKVCEHILKYNLSYRKTADIFGINFKTVFNYTQMIKNIDSELHSKVQKCLNRKKTLNYRYPNNLNNIYEKICEYYICGNTMKQTGIHFNSSNRSIHYLFHNYVKNNDPELYVMILNMIELNKLKSIKIRSGIRKMKNIEERINLCKTIIGDKLTLKEASEIFELDVKTVKNYINSIKNVDCEWYNKVCKHFMKTRRDKHE